MTAAQQHATPFPIGRDAPFSLPPVYEKTLLRDRHAKVRMADGRQAWFFHRHEDVRAVMLNPAMSANRSDPGYPAMSSGGKAAFRHFATFLISMDGEEHHRNRIPLIPFFSMKRMREFRPRIEAIVDEAIADLRAAGSPADLVTRVSSVVPRRVIAELMGVTPEHLARFYELAGRFLDRSLSAEDRDATAVAMRQNMDALVEHKRRHPGEDILGEEVRRQEREDGAVDVAALASLSQLMLLAGHESTNEMISLGVLALLRHPDQRQRLLDDPAGFPVAVAELIRYFSVVEIGMARVALEDVEVGGARIRRGDGVIASNVAANRDPAVFDDPHELRMDREPNPHVGQGIGAHKCLGINLAQVELSVVYERIFRALPDLRLAVSEADLPFKYDGLIFGLSSLPVAW
jgi:cytochrome P450